MTMTREQVAALLDGTTPGPWEVYDPSCGGVGIGVTQAGDLPDVCVMANTYDKRRPFDARLMAAAPDLARLCLSLMDRLADADKAQAALVERAAQICTDAEDTIFGKSMDLRTAAVTILALAPDAGVQALAALKAAASAANEHWLAKLDAEADRDRLAAELAEARAENARLQATLAATEEGK